MITETEQITSDIDWFFTNDEHIAFVASAGGKLPLSISESKENTKKLSQYFRELPYKCEIIINSELNKIIPAFDESYLSDFIIMAERGLFAYDKSVLNNFNDSQYHLVAQPTYPININDLPHEVMEILKKTMIVGQMESNLNIDSFPK